MSIRTLIIILLILIVSYKIIWPLVKVFLQGDVILNKSSKLSDRQCTKIAVGAIYASQQSAYQNSLETGLKAKAYTIANEWWGIDNKTDAQNNIEQLLNIGTRSAFKLIVEALNYDSHVEQDEFIIENIAEEDEMIRALTQLTNLRECLKELKENNIIENDLDIAKYGASAWDFGRAVFLARVCFDTKFITEEDAWRYIDKAYNLSVKSFSSWEDFARSYIIGRAMWGGKHSQNSAIISMAESLLKEPNSPWVKYDL